jgi:hypothetical protein
LVAGLEEANADFVFSLGVAVRPGMDFHLTGATRAGAYRAPHSAPATLWLFRREVVDDVGLWRNYTECYGNPSQGWLYRAWRAGKRIVLLPRLTAIIFESARRKDVCANRECWIQWV